MEVLLGCAPSYSEGTSMEVPLGYAAISRDWTPKIAAKAAPTDGHHTFFSTPMNSLHDEPVKSWSAPNGTKFKCWREY